MSGINSELDSLKREMERTEQSIESLCEQLGSAAYSYKSIICEAGFSIVQNLDSLSESKTLAQDEISAISLALSNIDSNDREIEKRESSIVDIEERLRMLISSLGAVASEIEAAGILPKELARSIAPLKEHREKVREVEEILADPSISSIRRLWYRRRLENLNASVEDVFSEVGQRIYESGRLDYLPGKRAEGLVSQIREIVASKRNVRKEIKEHRNEVSFAKDSLEKIGAYGEEKARLKELELSVKAMEKKTDALYLQYGKILSENESQWFSLQVPVDVRRICTRIDTEKKHYAQQQLHKKYLDIEKDIDVHNGLSSQLLSQKEHLEAQKQLIDKQILEIDSKVEDEKRYIAERRQAQIELSIEARNLE